jgi:hypothetical protein
MKCMEYLNQAVITAAETYDRSAGKSPRIVIDLLALAQLCHRDNSWLTTQVGDSEHDLARDFVPDLSVRTVSILRPGSGIVFLLPRPVSAGYRDKIEHVAVAHAQAGVPIPETRPAIVFRQDLLIYAAGTGSGALCGYVNTEDQPTLVQVKLLPGSSWSGRRLAYAARSRSDTS